MACLHSELTRRSPYSECLYAPAAGPVVVVAARPLAGGAPSPVCA